MEVIRGWTHFSFPMGDASCVGEARRHAAQEAAQLGFGDTEAGRLALVVTELGTNLLRHARQGQLLIAARPDHADIEVLAIDEGPGIQDVTRAMEDGFTTGNSPGTGLGAIKRLASHFDIHSAVPHGTVCLARVRKHAATGTEQAADQRAFEVGAVCVPLQGETACGDAWGAAFDAAGLTALVADGLGHGPEAAKPSQLAVATFLEAPRRDLRGIVEQVHLDLKTTRGAAVCLVRLSGDDETLRCAGAGNVAVRVVSGVYDRSMVTQHGTAGVQIRKPDETSMVLPLHALVVVHSDGIASRWDTQHILPVLGRDPALVAAILMRHHSRKRDDATIVVVRRRN
ncbi:ATP-binding protein/SpoIIE family protein phosphatase [Variovorax sp. J22R24]|uniref:ATP-binding SpoIIE family protein phosphatase n=1 Tax=Variovorax gracilis TaxID=3053502 RepID=UPI00257904FC|nr:ATP-binding SpoIIE family protein phosphatase [Variovorax sp. J22R24]MDM0104274.1 ATP-binding protein/SpoIIE family protein phosphatase [Variovorax sp. J22R24]